MTGWQCHLNHLTIVKRFSWPKTPFISFSSIFLNKWSTPSKYNSHLYNHVLLLISLLYFHYVRFVNISPFYLYNHRVYKVSPELSRKRRSHPLNIILPAQYSFQMFLIFLIILSGLNSIFIIPIPWFYLLLRTYPCVLFPIAMIAIYVIKIILLIFSVSIDNTSLELFSPPIQLQFSLWGIL